MKILIIDNYDSFTYNLYQLVGDVLDKQPKNTSEVSELTPRMVERSSITVKRNDDITRSDIKKNHFDRIIISPGPGNPEDSRYFGVCRDVILKLSLSTPILGVCLGMQGIASCFGAKVINAKVPMHGKTSRITHRSSGIFKGIPQNISVMRYHSLIVDKRTFPACLEVTAQSIDSSEIMGLRHESRPLIGVQFHPESFATEYGKTMLKNFIFQKSIETHRG